MPVAYFKHNVELVVFSFSLIIRKTIDFLEAYKFILSSIDGAFEIQYTR